MCCGSVRVKVGDHVRAGDQVGTVGNSGLSLQPHLHFQVMRSDDPFPLFHNLVPFRLRAFHRQVGREWKTMAMMGAARVIRPPTRLLTKMKMVVPSAPTA